MLKKCCDVCGKTHHSMWTDSKLKKTFGIKVDICLDCGAWLDDYDRYTRLLDNGIIDDEMYNSLINEDLEGK